MPNNNNALGKGLASIIPQNKKSEEPDLPFLNRGEKILKVPIEKIKANPWQPREVFKAEELGDLVASIREHGILQPLIVTKKGDSYELIAGERRFRAAKTLNQPTVPVIVREAEAQEKLELSLIENVQRQDLNALERARAYQKLINEFSLTQEEVAKKVGKSRASVANTLRLLNLDEEIKKALLNGDITEGHAKVIMSLEGEQVQKQFLKKIMQHGMSVQEASETAKKIPVKRHFRTVKPEQLALNAKAEKLEDALGTKVSIKKRGSRGEIVVEYYSEEELDNIIRRICR